MIWCRRQDKSLSQLHKIVEEGAQRLEKYMIVRVIHRILHQDHWIGCAIMWSVLSQRSHNRAQDSNRYIWKINFISYMQALISNSNNRSTINQKIYTNNLARMFSQSSSLKWTRDSISPFMLIYCFCSLSWWQEEFRKLKETQSILNSSRFKTL